MITLTTKELEKLRRIGKGKYGTVYQASDDIAYKIYHKTIHSKEGFDEINPANRFLKSRIRKLTCKQKNIQHTDLPKGVVKIDGRYGGVIIPYYEGKTLKQLKDEKYEIKKDLSKKLIEAHNELIKNRIYTSDYHLDNIMVINNEIKIIDLDDPLTHSTTIPNKLLKIISNMRVNETTRSFFNDSHFYIYDCEQRKCLNKNNLENTARKDWLNDFLEERERIQTYILINKESDINKIKDLLNNKDYRIIYMYNDDEYNITTINKIYNRFLHYGIMIYDFVEDKKINSYLCNYPTTEELLIDNSDVKAFKK